MLDLQARVGFDEGEVALVAGVHEELEGGEAAVIDGGGHADGGCRQALARIGAEEGAGRPFDDFLVAALEAAFALAQMGGRAAAVADHLHLDMAGAGQEPLNHHRRVAEGGLRFRLAARVGLGDLVGGGHDAHSAPAAAGDCLDHHRAALAERAEELLRLGERDGGGAAGQDGDIELGGEPPRTRFVAEQLERVDRGTDEGDPVRGAAAGECGAFGEEAVAGMQRVAAGRFGGFDDRFNIEVGARAYAAELMRFVGAADMQRGRVVGRVDGDGADAQLAGGADDANGDLAAVGDEQAFDRAAGRWLSGWHRAPLGRG